MSEAEPLYRLVGSKHHGIGREGQRGMVLRTREEVSAAYARHRRARWVVTDASAFELLSMCGDLSQTWHRVLVLVYQLSPGRREMLHARFRDVVGGEAEARMLSKDELWDVLTDERAEDFFIGGVVDKEDRVLVLYRGNLEKLLVPLQWFTPRAKGPKPDFDDFEVTDSGQTVRFGEYEAPSDAILYEFDADARKRMKEREIEHDASFGGALRRLRLQKGLRREDFEPVSAKTIARIERGEVDEPRGETLAVIAKRTGVAPGQIKTF